MLFQIFVYIGDTCTYIAYENSGNVCANAKAIDRILIVDFSWLIPDLKKNIV